MLESAIFLRNFGIYKPLLKIVEIRAKSLNGLQ